MARLKARKRTINGRRQIYGYCGVFYDPDQNPKERSVSLRTRDKRVAQRLLVELEKKFSLGEWDPWWDCRGPRLFPTQGHEYSSPQGHEYSPAGVMSIPQ